MSYWSNILIPTHLISTLRYAESVSVCKGKEEKVIRGARNPCKEDSEGCRALE